MQDSVYIGIKAHRRRRTVHTYNNEGHSELQSKFWFRNRNAKSACCQLQLLTTFQVFQALTALYQPF